ncbi:MAG: peptide ABC transporter substrate-binding protein [Candidatus Eremiobacteraeota bacterium]|nr:peptide ABC transporter substrate-binding protein [Candidatus Eremiobacteraeota bacterium]
MGNPDGEEAFFYGQRLATWVASAWILPVGVARVRIIIGVGALMVRRLTALCGCVGLLLGCARVATGVGGPGSQTPSGGGSTLTFTGLAAEPDVLNPMLSPSSDTVDFTHLFLSYLVESDDRNELQPEIAAEVPSQANGGIAKDGMTVTYHLRRGVVWQDGAPLTSRDVVWTFGAIMNPKNNVISRVGYNRIASVRSEGDNTVVVLMKRPFSPILSYFFCSQGNAAILPAHLLARYPDLNRIPYNQKPVGSGPFRVVEWRHNDRITLRANERYWRGPPKIGRIVFKIVPDPNTQAMQVATGEVDAYFGVDPENYQRVARLPDYTTRLTPLNDIHDLDFNLRDPIMRDVRVRRAVELAIDRPTLAREATKGVDIVTEGDQPSFGWAYDPHIARVPYDPHEAGVLLDEAGWRRSADGVRTKDGKRLDIQLAMAPAGVTASRIVAAVVQSDERAVGIAVTQKQYPIGLFWGQPQNGGVLQSGKYQMAYNAWWVQGPDPDDSWNFACDQMPPAGQNYYFWCDKKADAAIRDAQLTFDRARRKRDYAIVQNEIASQIPIVPLWEVRRIDTYSKRLRGVNPSPTGSTFWNAWRWSLSN